MNPSDKSCWRLCRVCSRCADKGKYAKCNSCSGRHDPYEKRDPYYIDDRCRCTEGIMQYLLKNGKLLQKRFPSNPFESRMRAEVESEEERDYNASIQEMRERTGIEDYDPVRFNDGTSTYDWTQRWKEGR